MFQRREGTADLALRLVIQRLERQNLDQADHPPAFFGRFLEALQERHRLMKGALYPVTPGIEL
jgi:hypothetical protein